MTLRHRVQSAISAIPDDRILELMRDAKRTKTGDIIVVRGPGPEAAYAPFIIDMTRMLYNYRLQITTGAEYGKFYEHAFCYFGTDLTTAIRAFRAGLRWGLDPDPLSTRPPDFDKEAY